jgi:putative phage-type endonuclease
MLTQEQLDARRTTIGASDAAPILGISPFKTALQLWKEKVEGVAQFQNAAMERGNKYESEARDHFIKKTNIFMAECPTFTHKERTWQTATPDGLSLCGNYLLEIKVNNEKHDDLYQMAKREEIPEYYMSQVQHQMAVLEKETVFFDVYCPRRKKSHTVSIPRDNAYIEAMIEKEYAFWKLVMDKTPPEEEKILKKILHTEWLELVEEKLINKELSTLLDERDKEITERLAEISGGEEAEGFGYKLVKVERKGNVDYSKIPQLIGVNTELFRKKSTTFWRVS